MDQPACVDAGDRGVAVDQGGQDDQAVVLALDVDACAGAFAASGDLSLAGIAAAALAGAVAGDQVGYVLGKRGGALIERMTQGHPRRAALIDRARAALQKRGPQAVFLSRWLVSPLGPYVNFAGGAAHLPRASFTFWSAAGECIWVGTYIGLGYGFSGQINAVAEITADVSGIVAMGCATLILAWALRARLRMLDQQRRD